MNDRTSLGERGRRGVLAQGVGQASKLVIQLGGLVILSRLLPPASFGLLAMVTVFVIVAEIVRDAGFSLAAIRQVTLSDNQASILYYVNLLVALGLTLVLNLIGPLVADFYNEASLVTVVALLSLIFPINALGSQSKVHLIRRLNFPRLAIVDGVAAFLGLVSAVGIATVDNGPIALVSQQLVTAGVSSLGYILSSPWRLKIRPTLEPIRPLLSFGLLSTATQILVFASGNITSIALGRFFGAAVLGFYNRAYQLYDLPASQLSLPINTFVIASLAQASDDGQRHRVLIRAHRCYTYVVGAIYGASAAVGWWIVPVVLGRQWASSGTILTILSIGGLFQVQAASTYWLFVTRGLAKQNLLFTLITRPVMVAAVCLAATKGPTAAAWAFSSALAMSWALGAVFLRRRGIRDRALDTLSFRCLATIGGIAAPSFLVGLNVISPVVGAVLTSLIVIAGAAIMYLTHFGDDIRQVAADVGSIVNVGVGRSK